MGNTTAAGYPPNTEWNHPPKEAPPQRSSAPLPPDSASDNGSHDEKDVKPILTKERRVEEGYKSVWFKEDIDPSAKQEVLIIPDSREDDSDEEDEEQNENERYRTRAPKVGFADADLDSGLGVKMDDPGEDSESDRDLNDDL